MLFHLLFCNMNFTSWALYAAVLSPWHLHPLLTTYSLYPFFRQYLKTASQIWDCCSCFVTLFVGCFCSCYIRRMTDWWWSYLKGTRWCCEIKSDQAYALTLDFTLYSHITGNTCFTSLFLIFRVCVLLQSL